MTQESTNKPITKAQYLVGVTNSIAKKYPDLRSKGKAPTFALQYNGTANTLHKRSGFPMEQALEIEASFHELYAVSGEFNDANQVLMEQDGFIECAFGLKLRTPIIAQCILGNRKTPYEAAAEVRSANNAVTQSWGMLLNRAMNACNKRIEESKYALDILPMNMIHDAGYFIIKDDPECIQFLNKVLIEEMQWNDHDLIRSMDVPMEAEMELGTSWASVKPLPNNASLEEIKQIIKEIKHDT